MKIETERLMARSLKEEDETPFIEMASGSGGLCGMIMWKEGTAARLFIRKQVIHPSQQVNCQKKRHQ